MSKGVVSLRSGFTECLLQAKVPLFCLYTNFRNWYIFGDTKVELALSGFGLKKLPNVNTQKVFEFNILEVDNKDVIQNILDNFRNDFRNSNLLAL